MRSLTRVAMSCVLAGLLAACDALGTKSNGAGSYPDIAGTWSLSFSYQLGADSIYTINGTLTMNPVDSAAGGTFTGPYALTTTGYTSDTGRVSGALSQYSSTGEGQVAFTQFGDAGRPLLYQAAVFAVLFPNCNFAPATFTLTNGGLTTSSIVLQGEFTNVRCLVGADSMTVLVTADASATK
jgi:hypothetical protein